MVLDALECGLEVKLDDMIILMGEDEKHKSNLCFKMFNYHNPNDIRLVEHDISMKHFIAACERLTDDEITGLVANIALNT